MRSGAKGKTDSLRVFQNKQEKRWASWERTAGPLAVTRMADARGVLAKPRISYKFTHTKDKKLSGFHTISGV